MERADIPQALLLLLQVLLRQRRTRNTRTFIVAPFKALDDIRGNKWRMRKSLLPYLGIILRRAKNNNNKIFSPFLKNKSFKKKSGGAGVVEPCIIIDTKDYYLSISIFRMNKHTHFLMRIARSTTRSFFMCSLKIKKLNAFFFIAVNSAWSNKPNKAHDDIV